jgi:hypothetical protein
MSSPPATLPPALHALWAALHDRGPNPAWHLAAYERHRREGPTLWTAIDDLLSRHCPECCGWGREATNV